LAIWIRTDRSEQALNLWQSYLNIFLISRRLPEELILDILEAHFSPSEAQRQLATAIDWGRYAELYSYDEPAGIIFLEQSPEVNQETSIADS